MEKIEGKDKLVLINKTNMNENNLDIEKNCGQSDFNNEQIPDIINDPNFVFA